MGQDSSQQRTEEATPERLREARKRGQVSHSKDLTSSLMLIAAAGTLAGLGSSALERFRKVSGDCFARAGGELSANELASLLAVSLREMLLALLPLPCVLVVLAIAAGFLQAGPVLSLDPLKPTLERLNPIAGIKNKVFSLRSLIEWLKAVFKVGVVAMLCFTAAKASLRDIVMTGTVGPSRIVDVLLLVASTILVLSLKRVLLFFLALGAVDLLYQRWQYRRDQRMTKDEVKRENREQEGDPTHKQARRQLHQEILANNMLADVRRKADVVVKNPTHLSCALSYDPTDDGEPPRLIAKGEGWLAEKIREAAREEGIPVVRNVPLARALYRLELDDYVPPELYEAVVEVLHWAEELAESRGRQARWKQPRDAN